MAAAAAALQLGGSEIFRSSSPPGSPSFTGSSSNPLVRRKGVRKASASSTLNRNGKREEEHVGKGWEEAKSFFR